MVRLLTQLGVCLSEVLVVHSKSLLQEFSVWTVVCVGASAAVTAWSLFQHWSPDADRAAARWQGFGLRSQTCRVVD